MQPPAWMAYGTGISPGGAGNRAGLAHPTQLQEREGAEQRTVLGMARTRCYVRHDWGESMSLKARPGSWAGKVEGLILGSKCAHARIKGSRARAVYPPPNPPAKMICVGLDWIIRLDLRAFQHSAVAAFLGSVALPHEKGLVMPSLCLPDACGMLFMMPA